MSVQAVIRAVSRRAAAHAQAEEVPSGIASSPKPSDHIVDTARADRAARVLQRRWLIYKYNKSLDRQNLINRLLLEDQLVVGVCRLVLFAFIFWLLVTFTSTGLSGTQQLEVQNLLDRSLDFEVFRNIRTVEELQDFVKHVSSRLKRYAPSGSQRIPEPGALQLLADPQTFVRPISLQGVNLPISSSAGGMTMLAWVEISEETKEEATIPLLRKPYPLAPERSCWGWFLGPTRFIYGAHDYHTLDKGSGVVEEEVIAFEGRPMKLTYEALVIANERIVFYRNGVPMKNVTLPRALTDCDSESLELGSSGLTVAAFKFYPRALLPNEIAEMYKGGQPLSELATSTVLPTLPADQFKQLQLAVDNLQADLEADTTAASVERSVRSSVDRSHVEESMAAACGPEKVTRDVLNPEDPSPQASLVFPETSGTLPSSEEWRNQTAIDLVESWTSDAQLPDLGQYWHLLENPLYLHKEGPVRFSTLPSFPVDTEAVTVSAWVRPLIPTKYGGGILAFTDLGSRSIASTVPFKDFNQTYLSMSFGGIYSDIIIGTSRPEAQSVCEFGGAMNSQGRIDEKYSISNLLSDPDPVPWRFMTWTVHFTERYMQMWLDAQLWSDTRVGSSCSNNYFSMSTWEGPILDHRSVAEYLDGAGVSMVYNLGYGPPTDNNPGVKVADVRIYPKALSAEAVSKLHEQSSWGNGGASKRQCVDVKLDRQYMDPVDKDESGNSCAWYAAQARQFPEVCTSPAAKIRCPVACRGVRECHDGSWAFDAATKVKTRYRIFDRVMLLSMDSSGLLCPSRSASAQREQILQRCLSQGSESEPFSRYRMGKGFEWTGAQRVDPTNCSAMREAFQAGQNQCEWDDSWMTNFTRDYEESGSWSIQFWMKPTQRSRGMPTHFWPSTSFFSSLAPLSVLLDIGLLDPSRIEWLTYKIATDSEEYMSDGFGGHIFAHVFPLGCCTEPTTSWTYYYAHVETLPSGVKQFCGAVNNIPLRCFPLSPGINQYFADPASFLEAVEFTGTEMLTSPIELSSDILSPAQVQKLYYEEAEKMNLLQGPQQTEKDRIKSLSTYEEKEKNKYDERLMLVSPPIIFQTRAQDAPCKRETTKHFIDMHMQLAFTHCQHDTCPWLNSSEAMFACLGPARVEPYMGLTPFPYNGEMWYNDFLYSFGENPFVVRNGQTFKTADFIDSQSKAVIITSFMLNPATGDIHQLQHQARFSGSTVETKVSIFHMSHINQEGRDRTMRYMIPYVVLVGIIVLYNIFLSWESTVMKKRWGLKCGLKTWADIFYDFGLCIALTVFTTMWGNTYWDSEQLAQSIAFRISTVPWADPDTPFEAKLATFFDAITELDRRLETERRLSSVGFVMLIFMLVRILKATEVHPRTALLIGTLSHGIMDLWHFAVMFFLCFYFFAVVSTWAFGNVRNDFKDLETSMQSQFDALLGNLPENYHENDRMIVYMALTNVVMYFLMFNFLLAIVVEAYEKVRDDIADNEVENEFFFDCALTLQSTIKKLLGRWPSRKELVYTIAKQIGSKSIDIRHLRLAGLPPKMAKDIIWHYYQYHPTVRSKEIHASIYDEAIRHYKDASFHPQNSMESTPSAETQHESAAMSRSGSAAFSESRTGLSVLHEHEEQQGTGQNESSNLGSRMDRLESKMEIMFHHQQQQMEHLASLILQTRHQPVTSTDSQARAELREPDRPPIIVEQQKDGQLLPVDPDTEISAGNMLPLQGYSNGAGPRSGHHVRHIEESAPLRGVPFYHNRSTLHASTASAEFVLQPQGNGVGGSTSPNFKAAGPALLESAGVPLNVNGSAPTRFAEHQVTRIGNVNWA